MTQIATRNECIDEGCTFSADGTCKRGVSPAASCPALKPEVTPAPITNSDFHEWPSAEAMHPENASVLTARSACRIIVVAGAVDSGKTTLLASIYESFQKGPFAGFYFARSETLVGFERRCFLSRMASGREDPETARTPYDPTPHFLHLRVLQKDAERGQAQDMLFTDLSGEAFRLVRDSDEECRRMTILRKADHVALLVDGKKLAEPEARHGATDDAMLILRRSLECGMLGKRSMVDVMLTKLDLVRLATEEADTALALWKKAQIRIRDRFEAQLGSLSFAETAARPRPALGLSTAHGCEEPFKRWVNNTLLPLPIDAYPLAEQPMKREFEHFARRYSSKLHGATST